MFTARPCLLAVAAAAVAACAAPATADEVAEFYSGRTVTYIQASSAGGGYAAYSRLIVQHLPRFIPGNPAVQLQFMQGAGGVKGANFVYSVAPRDGLTIGMPLAAVVRYQILLPDKVRYDAAKLNWFGSASPLRSIIAVWNTAAAKSLADAQASEVIIGATAKSADNYQQPLLANYIAGTKFKVVPGYKGSKGMDLAMQTGETHGRMSYWESWQVNRPDWISDRRVITLIQVGARPIKGLDAPRMIDLAKTPEQRAMVRLQHVTGAIGRAVYGPPGIPEARRAALGKAVEAVLNDPAFQNEARKRNVGIDPTPGTELTQIVHDALLIPQSVIARYKQVVGMN